MPMPKPTRAADNDRRGIASEVVRRDQLVESAWPNVTFVPKISVKVPGFRMRIEVEVLGRPPRYGPVPSRAEFGSGPARYGEFRVGRPVDGTSTEMPVPVAREE